MITNLIDYLYNIKIDYVRKSKSGYIFFYEDNFYIFKEFYGDKDNLKYIVNICNKFNLPYHEVVKNKSNDLLSLYQGINYILMKVKFKANRKLLITDLIDNNYYISYIPKKDFFWKKLWIRKIDQVEQYVLNNIDKFNIYVISIINYFLSLAEIAVNLFNSINEEFIPLSICHKRVNFEYDLYEFYCIDNLVLDHYTRDVGEFIKSYIYNKDKEMFLSYINRLSNSDRFLLLSRVLFPSYFFDLFDNYIFNNKDFKDFDVNFIGLSELNNTINAFFYNFSK